VEEQEVVGKKVMKGTEIEDGRENVFYFVLKTEMWKEDKKGQM
jgi:hypothetical protein